MTEHLKEILDEKFYDQLKNKDVSNSKSFICFAGVPYSGRTKIAKIIADLLQGVDIDKDIARTLIYENEKIENTQQPEDILDEYMPTVLKRLIKVENGLLVIDASIDRKADEYKKWTEENGYKLIVVSVEVNRKTAEDVIKKERDAGTAEWFIAQYDRWYADHEKFLAENKPDFTIENIENDLPDLIEKIKKLVQ
jgi:hypothetical protein